MASQSSGSATGNPRNKVALKPGHSLMDWIRLGNSGADLSGTKGAILDISSSELAKHNKESDAWLCIRGKVYNVTRYMNFHPGGEEELMKGAGKDATSLFNKVHPWVNYESLLQKCLVGRLVNVVEEDVFSSLKPAKSNNKSSNKEVSDESVGGALTSIVELGNCIVSPNDVPSLKRSPKKVLDEPPSTDWYQQKDFATFVIYHKDLKSHVVHVDAREGQDIWIKVGNLAWVGWSTPKTSWPPLISHLPSKTEIRIDKMNSKVWSEVKTLTGEPAKFQLTDAKVSYTSKVTHNVFLVHLSFVVKVHFHVPVGYHVPIMSLSPLCRHYTPIEALAGQARLTPSGSGLWLLVKRYPGGAMSPQLTKDGTDVSVCPPEGSYTPPSPAPSFLLLLAAGTGITPMIRIINQTLRDAPRTKIKLVFFNKAEKDIIWRKEFDDLSTGNINFSVDHVLSEASTDWGGQKGWVTLQLLQSLLPEYASDNPSGYYTCVCGPISFTQLTERYLLDMGYDSQHYFCFRG